ncbi:hypothetical protein L9F63_024475, partial [Diploptera punctata]
ASIGSILDKIHEKNSSPIERILQLCFKQRRLRCLAMFYLKKSRVSTIEHALIDGSSSKLWFGIGVSTAEDFYAAQPCLFICFPETALLFEDACFPQCPIEESKDTNSIGTPRLGFCLYHRELGLQSATLQTVVLFIEFPAVGAVFGNIIYE